MTVLDQFGSAITDFRAADVSVREDGAPREVFSVEHDTEPLFVAVVLDTTQPPPGNDAGTADLRTAVTAFITTLHAAMPTAEVALMECAGAPALDVDFTTRTDDLTRTAGRLFPSPPSGAVLLEALMSATERLGDRPGPRRVVVSVNFDSAESSNVQADNVIAAFQRVGATLWAVSLRRTGSTTSTPIRDEGQNTRANVLDRLPAASGGQHVSAIGTSALETILTRVARNLTSQYESHLRASGRRDVGVVSITPGSTRGVEDPDAAVDQVDDGGNGEMSQWANGPMSQWTNEPMGQWANGPMGQWANELMSQWAKWGNGAMKRSNGGMD